MSLLNVKTGTALPALQGRAWLCERAGALRTSWNGVRERVAALSRVARGLFVRGSRDEEGQGTTEYALVVGVLVVIAIAALTSVREKIQMLWDAITGAMGTL